MERSKMEKNLEQLKHSIATGEMTGSELVRRLQMMIQQEISKPEKEVDTEFIEACSSLIEHVYPAIAERPEGYYEEQEAKFKLRLQQKEKERKRQRILRPAIAFAAVLVIVFLSVGSIRFHWFTMESTPDQQQVIIQGHEVSVDMVEKAIAEHQKEGYFQAKSISELSKYLGFDLEYLSGIPEQWEVSEASTIINQEYITVFIRFINLDNENSSFQYTINWLVNYSDSYYSIEQNENGYFKKINGIDVYYSNNTNSSSCSWVRNNSIHVITAQYISDEIESVVELLVRSSI